MTPNHAYHMYACPSIPRGKLGGVTACPWGAKVLRPLSIPRKVRQVVGPSHLCSAIGTPNAAYAAFSVPKSVAHTGECGGPIKMKSSR